MPPPVSSMIMGKSYIHEERTIANDNMQPVETTPAAKNLFRDTVLDCAILHEIQMDSGDVVVHIDKNMNGMVDVGDVVQDCYSSKWVSCDSYEVTANIDDMPVLGRRVANFFKVEFAEYYKELSEMIPPVLKYYSDELKGISWLTNDDKEGNSKEIVYIDTKNRKIINAAVVIDMNKDGVTDQFVFYENSSRYSETTLTISAGKILPDGSVIVTPSVIDSEFYKTYFAPFDSK